MKEVERICARSRVDFRSATSQRTGFSSVRNLAGCDRRSVPWNVVVDLMSGYQPVVKNCWFSRFESVTLRPKFDRWNSLFGRC
jgi:hypothetical protein